MIIIASGWIVFGWAAGVTVASVVGGLVLTYLIMAACELGDVDETGKDEEAPNGREDYRR